LHISKEKKNVKGVCPCRFPRRKNFFNSKDFSPCRFGYCKDKNILKLKDFSLAGYCEERNILKQAYSKIIFFLLITGY